MVFFDDDFIPSNFWIERLHALLAMHPDVVCVTGHVLLDGVTIGGVERSTGNAIVDSADSLKTIPEVRDSKARNDPLPYGCNMAFRTISIKCLKFDERLVQYGWLEDRDFAFYARKQGRMIWTDGLWGVHLGTKGGRVSGLRFGYSQVVNPWYLMKKGSMTSWDSCGMILRGVAGNAFGIIYAGSHADRWGRLTGNIIGIKDIVRGRWAPEKISEL